MDERPDPRPGDLSAGDPNGEPDHNDPSASGHVGGATDPGEPMDRGWGGRHDAAGGAADPGEPNGPVPQADDAGEGEGWGPSSGSELRLPSDRVRDEARRAIEAIVLVADDPLPTQLIAQLLELSPDIVDELCRELAGEYEAEGRGFQLVRVAGGWRYQTHPDQGPYVERFVLEGQPAKLSAAALETVAIVAYKQPVSRAQVAAIRGVTVDGVMRTLQQRGYIEEVARDPGPGQAVLYGTTQLFLERLGLNGLDELPALGDFVPSADVVEQLEQGLRPSGPADPDRYDAPDPSATDAGSVSDDDADPGRYGLAPSADDPDADSHLDDGAGSEP